MLYTTCYWHFVGAWRSLEAHLNGVQGVGGSNPLAPTSYFNRLQTATFFLVGEYDNFATVRLLGNGQSVKHANRFPFILLIPFTP